MDCINLNKRFGGRFVVRYEESYYAERTRHTSEVPWLMIIPCRNGHICPWGRDRLAACTKSGQGTLVKRLLAVPGAKLEQDGQDGVNVSFPLEAAVAIFDVIRPHRNPQRTEAQRQAAIERLRKYQFQPQHAMPRGRNEQRRDSMPSCDPESHAGCIEAVIWRYRAFD